MRWHFSAQNKTCLVIMTRHFLWISRESDSHDLVWKTTFKAVWKAVKMQSWGTQQKQVPSANTSSACSGCEGWSGRTGAAGVRSRARHCCVFCTVLVQHGHHLLASVPVILNVGIPASIPPAHSCAWLRTETSGRPRVLPMCLSFAPGDT